MLGKIFFQAFSWPFWRFMSVIKSVLLPKLKIEKKFWLRSFFCISQRIELETTLSTIIIIVINPKKQSESLQKDASHQFFFIIMLLESA